MANYGIKVSKEGFDVLTCTDDQLVFTSKLQTLKTYATGTINNLGITSVSHGLGYKPAFLTTNKIDTGKYSLATDMYNQAGVTTSNLYLGFSWATNNMRYYIFHKQIF